MTRCLDRERCASARWYGDIEIDRVGGNAVNGTFLAPKCAAHDAHLCAVIVRDLRNISTRNFLVSRRSHLECRRKVCPQLKSMHPASRIAFGHLLMDDASSSRHPLNVAGTDR